MSRLRSSYDHPLHKAFYTSGHNLKHLLPGSGWFCRPWSFLLFDIWTIFNKSYLKIFYWIGFGEKGLGGLVALGSLLTLESELELSIPNQMSLLRSLYGHNAPMPPEHNLQSLSWALGRWFDTRVFLIWPLNYFKQNGYLKIVIVWVWGNKGLETLVALRSLLTLQNWTRTFSFQSHEPSLKYIWASLS